MRNDLQKPNIYFRSQSKDMLFGGILLLGVVLASVAVGRMIGEDQIANWGTWIGAFVAGIAMVVSSYALVLQAKHAESSSWAIALSRLGQLYDQAYQDEELAGFLVEPSDPDGRLPESVGMRNLNDRQTVWLGSLGLAFEQIYIATNSLSSESQRVWRLYLRNQLNKPTIRSAFVRDATSALDYHQEFWRFIRGSGTTIDGRIVYQNAAVDSKYFDTAIIDQGMEDFSSATADFSGSRATEADMSFWLEMYRDEEVKKQMYAAPLETPSDLWDYLSPRQVFTVWLNANRVGGFTISLERDLLATFGIVIHPTHRKKRISQFVVQQLEKEAKKMGVKTLRADVYDDNFACIKSLSGQGFRRFIWMEKNI